MVQQADINTVFSAERFATYQRWATANGCDPLELYEWNTRLSQALYPGLQTLEVVLRNQIHARLSRSSGNNWVTGNAPFLNDYQRHKIQETRETLERSGTPRTPGQFVASLSFGFWTSFFGKNFEPLWRTQLKGIVGDPTATKLIRKDFSAPLSSLRLLRNRIAHYEPIIHYTLEDDQEDIKRLTGWLSPAAEVWRERICSFDAIYGEFTNVHGGPIS